MIFGKKAKQEIRSSNGAVGGNTLAVIGMTLGMVELALFALGIIGTILAFVIPIIVQIVLRWGLFN